MRNPINVRHPTLLAWGISAMLAVVTTEFMLYMDYSPPSLTSSVSYDFVVKSQSVSAPTDLSQRIELFMAKHPGIKLSPVLENNWTLRGIYVEVQKSNADYSRLENDVRELSEHRL